ncbi:reverse transcriptase domain-containing protein [Tanacetum coccineum]|uniref:Reverse transcriptase domain-containing protein n=1 Tax=Tanacetum coccineum TaxID=301880 RepID=A0ABQ5DZD1_9ASTR
MTARCGRAFQQMKGLIMDASIVDTITTTLPRRKRYTHYLVGVLGGQSPHSYSLVNKTRKAKEYFEAHPVKTTNAVKGQVLADFLSDAPDGEREDEYFQSPEVPPEIDDTEADPLTLTGSASSKGSGAGLVLTGPSGVEYAYALRLTFASTNNEAEYEALLAGLHQEILSKVLNERSTEVREVQTIVEEEGDNWMTPIIKYLEEGIVPSDKNEARALRAKIGQYTMESGVLFKKGYLIPMLRCETYFRQIMSFREIHLDLAECSSPIAGKAAGQDNGQGDNPFVMDNIICRYGLPRIIVTDNGAQLINDPSRVGVKFEINKETAGSSIHRLTFGRKGNTEASCKRYQNRLGREKAGWWTNCRMYYGPTVPRLSKATARPPSA